MAHSKKVNLKLSLIAAVVLLPVWRVYAHLPLSVHLQQPQIGEPVVSHDHTDTTLYSGCGDQIVPAFQEAYEQKVVDLVNSTRADNNLPPLKHVPELSQAARYQAADMVQDNYLHHDTYDRISGQLKFVCDWFDRVGSFYGDEPYYWLSLAENIAGGQATPAQVMSDWMGSGDHRANIISTNYWEIGVGYYAGGGDYSHYWVQDFGLREGLYPLIINRDTTTTDSRTVSLYIYGDWEEMRLRNDDGPWSHWQPFQNEFTWSLGQGIGTHTVTAELQDGQYTVSSIDDIYLTVDDGTTVIGNLPDALHFIYSIPDQVLGPASWSVTPLNITDQNPLAWSLTTQGQWFSVTPSQGTTPDSFIIQPDKFDTKHPNTYIGKFTLVVDYPPGVEGSPHTTVVTLKVVDQEVFQLFIPLILGE